MAEIQTGFFTLYWTFSILPSTPSWAIHMTESLIALYDTLNTLHANKDIFVELGIRQIFNIPKLHSLWHYSGLIKLFSTTDNYNTQATEHLHINYMKEAY
jgi:hypothetical protein